MFLALVARKLNAAETAILKDRQMIARFIVTLLEASRATRDYDSALLVFYVFEFRLVELAHYLRLSISMSIFEIHCSISQNSQRDGNWMNRKILTSGRD